MADITIRDMVEFFRSASARVAIPFANSEMVAAIKEAGLTNDIDSLQQLCDVITNAYVRANTDKPNEVMVRNALDTIATLAYLADHDPGPSEWMADGPVKAYQRGDLGRAMTLVKKVYDARRIDMLRDVFQTAQE